MSVSPTPTTPEPTPPGDRQLMFDACIATGACVTCFGAGIVGTYGRTSIEDRMSTCGACGGSGRATTEPPPLFVTDLSDEGSPVAPEGRPVKLASAGRVAEHPEPAATEVQLVPGLKVRRRYPSGAADHAVEVVSVSVDGSRFRGRVGESVHVSEFPTNAYPAKWDLVEAGGSPVPATPPAAEPLLGQCNGCGAILGIGHTTWCPERAAERGRVAARDTLIQAALRYFAAADDEYTDTNAECIAAYQDLRAAVGVFRANQTPEGDST